MPNTASQTNSLLKLSGAAKQAVDLFTYAGGIALELNALGVVPTQANPTAAPDAEAFTGQLAELTPLDAVAVVMLFQRIQALVNETVDIGGQPVVLGTPLLKFNLANTNR